MSEENKIKLPKEFQRDEDGNALPVDAQNPFLSPNAENRGFDDRETVEDLYDDLFAPLGESEEEKKLAMADAQAQMDAFAEDLEPFEAGENDRRKDFLSPMKAELEPVSAQEADGVADTPFSGFAELAGEGENDGEPVSAELENFDASSLSPQEHANEETPAGAFAEPLSARSEPDAVSLENVPAPPFEKRREETGGTPIGSNVPVELADEDEIEELTLSQGDETERGSVELSPLEVEILDPDGSGKPPENAAGIVDNPVEALSVNLDPTDGSPAGKAESPSAKTSRLPANPTAFPVEEPDAYGFSD